METASFCNNVLMTTTSAVTEQIQKCSKCMAQLFHYSGTFPIACQEEAKKIENEECNLDRFIGYQKDQFQQVLNELHQSDFYYKEMSKDEATNLLIDKGPGHFLVRESKSTDNYFTLTFKNQKNEVKNTRIQYSFGLFYISTSSKKSTQKSSKQEESHISPSPTLFTNSSKGKPSNSTDESKLKVDSVVKLIELYLKKSKQKTDKSAKRIYLTTPVKHSVSSLKHVCRVCVNGEVNNDTNVLPKTLKDYVANYPYQV